jgi:hypothetical protein
MFAPCLGESGCDNDGDGMLGAWPWIGGGGGEGVLRDGMFSDNVIPLAFSNDDSFAPFNGFGFDNKENQSSQGMFIDPYVEVGSGLGFAASVDCTSERFMTPPEEEESPMVGVAVDEIWAIMREMEGPVTAATEGEGETYQNGIFGGNKRRRGEEEEEMKEKSFEERCIGGERKILKKRRV